MSILNPFQFTSKCYKISDSSFILLRFFDQNFASDRDRFAQTVFSDTLRTDRCNSLDSPETAFLILLSDSQKESPARSECGIFCSQFSVLVANYAA
jgi:hypothetical protein